MNVSCEEFGEMRYVCRILTGKLRERDHLEDVSVDGRKNGSSGNRLEESEQSWYVSG